MREWTLILLLCLTTACAGRPPQPPRELLFLKAGTLVDPRARKVSKAELLIGEGRILEVLAPGTPAPAGARTVDITGRFVIPGLVDLHVHSWGNPSPIEGGATDVAGHPMVLRRMLYAGVTAILDLGSSADTIFPLRDRQRADSARVPGARLFAAGPVMGYGHALPGSSGYFAFSTPEEARWQVSALSLRRPDVIKILYDHVARDPERGLNAELIGAAIGEAKKLGLKTVVHIGTWRDAREAVLAGAAAITHLFDSALIPKELAALMKEKGVVEIPTMAVQGDLYRIRQDPDFLKDPLLMALVPAGLLADYRKPDSQLTPKCHKWLVWQKADIPIDFDSIRRLRDAGVTLLAGSDSANLGTFQGFSLHREIELLHEAGLPAWDALAAGTTRAAEFLGMRYGLAKGDLAELVILTDSPLGKIANTRKVEAVVHEGRYLGPRERAELLDSGAASLR